jgi:cellulose synthase/poly-beta-1,6-N-acetylglucosamine synthase-like glycosyltransferase
VGDNVPIVDVLIVACGEPTDIVIDTVRAACQIDYPVEKMRVILADDGADELLKDECEDLVKKHANLLYHARVKDPGVPHGYKAGNLNNVIRTLPRDDGQIGFVLVLDADMIPEPEILRALIPHALKDEKVGMVTIAQVSSPGPGA